MNAMLIGLLLAATPPAPSTTTTATTKTATSLTATPTTTTSWADEHERLLLGTGLGAVGGAVVGAGAVALVGASCVPNQSCPWGADGGAIIGVIAGVPIAGALGLGVGAIVGFVVGATMEHQDEEAYRARFAARAARVDAARTAPQPYDEEEAE